MPRVKHIREIWLLLIIRENMVSLWIRVRHMSIKGSGRRGNLMDSAFKLVIVSLFTKVSSRRGYGMAMANLLWKTRNNHSNTLATITTVCSKDREGSRATASSSTKVHSCTANSTGTVAGNTTANPTKVFLYIIIG